MDSTWKRIFVQFTVELSNHFSEAHKMQMDQIITNFGIKTTKKMQKRPKNEHFWLKTTFLTSIGEVCWHCTLLRKRNTKNNKKLLCCFI
jgi:hypothetical protein